MKSNQIQISYLVKFDIKNMIKSHYHNLKRHIKTGYNQNRQQIQFYKIYMKKKTMMSIMKKNSKFNNNIRFNINLF